MLSADRTVMFRVMWHSMQAKLLCSNVFPGDNEKKAVHLCSHGLCVYGVMADSFNFAIFLVLVLF